MVPIESFCRPPAEFRWEASIQQDSPRIVLIRWMLSTRH